MNVLARLKNALLAARGVMVLVHATRGSVPREVGAWMAVWPHTTLGTVGGGRLELDAIAHARKLLQAHPDANAKAADEVVRYALGPSLGQCCGGEVSLRFVLVEPEQAAQTVQPLRSAQPQVALFGGGHVGTALVQVLGDLPVDVLWIDSRDEVFPSLVPDNVVCEHSNPVHRAVDHLAAGSRVLIMSFSHAEDLDIVAACLLRQRLRGDLPYIGLIGSATKWAAFRQRLLARGLLEPELAHVTCPIGVPGVRGKQPEIIAVAVAAQLLQVMDGTARSANLGGK